MRILLFILLIPFLASLGHDIYYNYLSDDIKIKQLQRLQIDPNDFKPSDFGWLWREYGMGTFEAVRDSANQNTWKNYIDPVLRQSAVITFGLGLLTVLALMLINKVVSGGIPMPWKLIRNRSKKNDFQVFKHAKQKSMKFKKRN